MMNLNGVQVDSILKPLFTGFLIMRVAIIITIAVVIVEFGYSGLLVVMDLFHLIRTFV